MESFKIHYKIVYKIFGRTNLHTQLIQKYHNRNPPFERGKKERENRREGVKIRVL